MHDRLATQLVTRAGTDWTGWEADGVRSKRCGGLALGKDAWYSVYILCT